MRTHSQDSKLPTLLNCSPGAQIDARQTDMRIGMEWRVTRSTRRCVPRQPTSSPSGPLDAEILRTPRVSQSFLSGSSDERSSTFGKTPTSTSKTCCVASGVSGGFSDACGSANLLGLLQP